MYTYPSSELLFALSIYTLQIYVLYLTPPYILGSTRGGGGMYILYLKKKLMSIPTVPRYIYIVSRGACGPNSMSLPLDA